MIQLFLYNQIMIKILLAEDNQDWLCLQKTLLEEYFGKDEYGICFVKDARTALNCLKQEKYDAVITDLQMESDSPIFGAETEASTERTLGEERSALPEPASRIWPVMEVVGSRTSISSVTGN